MLKQLKFEQQKIEAIAQTPQNTPGLQMLVEQAIPQATIMLDQITKMIDIEAQLEATPGRKYLLGMTADVRGTLGLSLANIRGYLLTGNADFKQNYEQLWEKNEAQFSDLTNNSTQLNYKQSQAFKRLKEARVIFASLAPRMLELRNQDNWNLANYWLATKAAPLGSQIKVILKDMADNQALLLAEDSLAITDKAEKATTIS